MSYFTTTGQMTTECFDEITRIMAAEDAGENPFNLIHRTEDQIAQDAERAEVAKQVAATLPVKTGSKKDQAIAIYVGLEDKSRKAVIEALVAAGFGKATSSTYQAQMKNWIV